MSTFMETAGRTRTVSWDDPMMLARAVPTMSGIEYIRALAGGSLPAPPMVLLMGLTIVEVDEGRVVFEVEPAEYHYNAIGVAHGGLACTALDSAMGCAVHTILPAGTGYTTLEIKVNLLRPLTLETGPVRCEGKTIHVGRTVATAEARMVDRNGKLYAHGTCTCMIFRAPAEGEG